MTSTREASKNIGNVCCRPWTGQGNPARKKKIGILLVIIGLIWLGAKLELLDLSWMQVVPFWPVIIILLGILMVYKSSRKEKQE